MAVVLPVGKNEASSAQTLRDNILDLRLQVIPNTAYLSSLEKPDVTRYFPPSWHRRADRPPMERLRQTTHPGATPLALAITHERVYGWALVKTVA